MSNLDRAAVNAFRNEPWPSQKGVEVTAAAANLPPLYISGFDPSLSEGQLTVAAGEAAVGSNRVTTDETLIVESMYVVYLIGSTSYYLYLDSTSSFFVDVIAPEVDEATRALSHKFRDGRYILYFETDTNKDVSIAHKALPSELAAGDLANATARDEIAQQLGYTDYATMITTVSSMDRSLLQAGF